MNPKLDPMIFFNLHNALFWLITAIVILIESWQIGQRWPEARRWWTGWVTLFGGTLLMVIFFGWDFDTWLHLALLTALMRAIRIDKLLFDSLWQRRENQRWTAQYFTGFLLTIPPMINGDADLLTWAEIFCTLGICGAVKVGFTSGRESYLARQLRRQSAQIPIEAIDNGRTD